MPRCIVPSCPSRKDKDQNLLPYTMAKNGVKEEVANGVGELLLTWLYSDLVPGSVHEAI